MKKNKLSLHVLGVGHATVTRCYNTCFAIKNNEDEYFLIDAGGGNGILKQLKDADISLNHVHHMFLTHMHTDHVMGAVWIIRMVATAVLKGSYRGELYIYCKENLSEDLYTMCKMMLAKKHLACVNREIKFVPIEDGTKKDILGMQVEFLDIHSTKMEQYGCKIRTPDNKILFFAGDEPICKEHEPLAMHADWLLHEAFCTERDAAIYKPYEKHHSTAKDAAQKARELNAKNLVLWHSEDDTYENKEKLYRDDASTVFG